MNERIIIMLYDLFANAARGATPASGHFLPSAVEEDTSCGNAVRASDIFSLVYLFTVVSYHSFVTFV